MYRFPIRHMSQHLFVLLVAITIPQVVFSNNSGTLAQLDKSKSLMSILTLVSRPTMDQVIAAAENDQFFNNKVIAEELALDSRKFYPLIEELIGLEVLFPQYQLFTLGRDAVAYSDLFDAISIKTGSRRRAMRVNLSGEVARHEKEDVLYEYLLSLGFPKNKEELFRSHPIVFMDYTDFGNDSQLRRLIEILKKRYDIADKEWALFNQKIIPLVTSGNHITIHDCLIRGCFDSNRPLKSSDDIPRGLPFNGKFDKLVKSQGSFETPPGVLEKPTMKNKIESLIQMLSFYQLVRPLNLRNIAKNVILKNKSKLLLKKYFHAVEEYCERKSFFSMIDEIDYTEKTQTHTDIRRLAKVISKIPAIDKNYEFIRHLKQDDLAINIKFINDVLPTLIEFGGDGVRKVIVQNILHKISDKSRLKITELLIRFGSGLIFVELMKNQFINLEEPGLLAKLLNQGDSNVLQYIIYHEFRLNNRSIRQKRELVEAILKRGDMGALNDLAEVAFIGANAIEMKDLVFKLINQTNNSSVYRQLLLNTFDNTNVHELKDVLLLLIEKGDSSVHRDIVYRILSKPYASDLADLIEILIRKGDLGTMSELVKSVFSQDHAIHREDLLQKIIDQGDASLHERLAEYVFVNPKTYKMENLIGKILINADDRTLNSYAKLVFSKPHTEGMSKLVSLLIKRGSKDVHLSLAAWVFSQPHAVSFQKELDELIAVADMNTLNSIAYNVFYHPYSKDMFRSIKKIIERGDDSVCIGVAKYVLSRPHTQNMVELVRDLAEKMNFEELRYLNIYVLNAAHAQSSAHKIIGEAIKIQDKEMRKSYLKQHLDKVGSCESKMAG